MHGENAREPARSLVQLFTRANGVASDDDGETTSRSGSARERTQRARIVTMSTKEAVRIGLFAFGYPTAIVVICRFVPVVRERRIKWFVAHELAVAAIVAGWALDDDTRAVVINGSWLVIAAVWYTLGGRRTT
jgi:hypothetical protein